MILAFESSCDETSVAVVDGTKILANEWFSQIRHHKKWGGVVPELASRLHCEVIDTILNRALDKAGVSLQDITHIATTVGPGLEGSLLVGSTAANMLAQLLKVPIIPVNHLHGHIYSALADTELKFPLMAFIASGGHTMLVHMTDEVSFNIVANTVDDACGESFDKVARMLGLGYPGGPEIEKQAKLGEACIELPHPVQSKPDTFSFSGLKTAVLQIIESYEAVPVADISASFQQMVAKIMLKKIAMALDNYPSNQLILCGGVFCNEHIRQYLTQSLSDIDIVIPHPSLCTDNAGMIGLAASVYLKHAKKPSDFVDVQTRLGLKLPKEILCS